MRGARCLRTSLYPVSQDHVPTCSPFRPQKVFQKFQDQTIARGVVHHVPTFQQVGTGGPWSRREPRNGPRIVSVSPWGTSPDEGCDWAANVLPSVRSVSTNDKMRNDM